MRIWKPKLAPKDRRPAVSRAVSKTLESLEPRSMFTTVALPTNAIEIVNPSGGWTSADGASFALGTGIHVRASTATLAAHAPTQSKIEWSFADTGSAHNTLRGFNAAHLYENTGTYQINLSITDPTSLDTAGKPITYTDTISVTVAPRTGWRDIYVDATGGGSAGSDTTGTGTSTAPYASLAKALNSLTTDGARIILRRGDQFDVTASMDINKNNVVITSTADYANSSASATLPKVYANATNSFNVFNVPVGKHNVTIEHLAFDSNQTTQGSAARPNFISGGGNGTRKSNVVLNDISFDHVSSFVEPIYAVDGLLVQNTRSVDDESVNRYDLFSDGDHLGVSAIGNTFKNTWLEHNVRTYGDYVLAADNTISNYVDGPGGKSFNTLRANNGEYIYWADNTLTGGQVSAGTLSIGPNDGGLPDDAVRNLVMEGNEILAGTAQTYRGGDLVLLGNTVQHATLRNNYIQAFAKATTNPNNTSGVDGSSGITATTGAYETYRVDNQPYPRLSEDVRIYNNTLVNKHVGGGTALWGNAIIIEDTSGVGGSYGADVFDIRNNLYIAPDLKLGGYDSAPLRIRAPINSGLSVNAKSVKQSSGNVWSNPDPGTNSSLVGKANLVGGANAGYVLNTTWNGYSQVSNDRFVNVTLATDGRTPSDATANGSAAAPGVFDDLLGQARPASGTVTAGAVQYAAAATEQNLTQTGTILSSALGSGYSASNVFDGNFSTIFYGATNGNSTSPNYVGRDLGAAYRITQIKYASAAGKENLMNGGIFQAANQTDFSDAVTIASVGASEDPSGTSLTAKAVTDTAAYRYVRYLAPNFTYGRISEMEIYGVPAAPTAAELTGTAFSSTTASFGAAANAFDNDYSTVFYGATNGSGSSPNYVGLDLGSAKRITEVKYASRAGQESRMNGGIFQGSNTSDFSSGVVTLATIGASENPSGTSLSTQSVMDTGTYRYVRYLAPDFTYGALSEIKFIGY